MQLKSYQQTIIEDIRLYCEQLQRNKRNPKLAYEAFRTEKAKVITPSDHPRPYHQTLGHNPPQICIKVPTAGGKTFLAVNALEILFAERNSELPKLVVRLVPSEAIMTQTINNLKNSDHPYRQQLNLLFQHRVTILTKQEALQGIGFSPSNLQEGITILVMIFNSLRIRTKEERKINQENSGLSVFPKVIDRDDIDETSLTNALIYAQPIVIIDEAHHTSGELSIDMLELLAPDFIFELTATPKPKANIISFATAIQLKKEHMVKLPVVVYNQASRDAVLENAINLQKQLEQVTIEEEAITGIYIRPIVLLQAQGKQGENETQQYNAIKEALIARNIPEEQIKIKVANKDELQGIDLTSKLCPVRYIITINALQEGRDCPFAYILTSIANKSSETDVTQLLGRILRQPHTIAHSNSILNACYVITSSQKFSDVLEKIVRSLNDSGYSSKLHYNNSSQQEQASFVGGFDHSGSVPLSFDAIQIEGSEQSTSQAKSVNNTKEYEAEDENEIFVGNEVRNITMDISTQLEEARHYITTIEQQMQTSDDDLDPNGKAMQKFPMKTLYEESVKSLLLPQFHHRITAVNLLEQIVIEEKIKKTDCLGGFILANCDKKIDLSILQSELFEVDVREQETSQQFSAESYRKGTIAQQITAYLKTQPNEVVIKKVLNDIMRDMKPIDEYYDKDMRQYLLQLLQGLSNDQIEEIKEHFEAFEDLLKKKIKQLEREYSSKRFETMIASNTFFLKPSFSFPITIKPKISKTGIPKSLYEEEGDMNEFELSVIRKIAELENVVRRHRNIEKTGFVINGRINHYPDFIVKTNNTIILIETKGGDRDNSDSMDKLALGSARASCAGINYKYFMIFQDNPIKGSLTVEQAVGIVSSL